MLQPDIIDSISGEGTVRSNFSSDSNNPEMVIGTIRMRGPIDSGQRRSETAATASHSMAETGQQILDLRADQVAHSAKLLGRHVARIGNIPILTLRGSKIGTLI